MAEPLDRDEVMDITRNNIQHRIHVLNESLSQKVKMQVDNDQLAILYEEAVPLYDEFQKLVLEYNSQIPANYISKDPAAELSGYSLQLSQLEKQNVALDKKINYRKTIVGKPDLKLRVSLVLLILCVVLIIMKYVLTIFNPKNSPSSDSSTTSQSSTSLTNATFLRNVQTGGW